MTYFTVLYDSKFPLSSDKEQRFVSDDYIFMAIIRSLKCPSHLATTILVVSAETQPKDAKLFPSKLFCSDEAQYSWKCAVMVYGNNSCLY